MQSDSNKLLNKNKKLFKIRFRSVILSLDLNYKSKKKPDENESHNKPISEVGFSN